jgi:hypothetical protein
MARKREPLMTTSANRATPLAVFILAGLLVASYASCNDSDRGASPQSAQSTSVGQVPDADWNREVGALVTPEASKMAYDFVTNRGLPNSWAVELIKSGLSMGILDHDRESLAALFGMVLQTSETGGESLQQVQQTVLAVQPSVISLALTFHWDKTKSRSFLAGALATQAALRKQGFDEAAQSVPRVASGFASREVRLQLYSVMSSAGLDPGALRAALQRGNSVSAFEQFSQTASNLERSGDQAELDFLNQLRAVR